MPQNIVLQCRLTGLELSPRDLAIAVVIEAHREFAVANREFNGAGNLRAVDSEIQKSIAGNVCLRQRTGQHQQPYAADLQRHIHGSARTSCWP
jgi:hypothetical protein